MAGAHETMDAPVAERAEGTALASAPESAVIYLQKIQEVLKVISELEIEQLRLSHCLALTNTILSDPSLAASAMLYPPFSPAAASVDASSTTASATALSQEHTPAAAAPCAPLDEARATENDFEAAFVHSLRPLAIADGYGAFVDCNVRFSQLTGFDRDEIRRLTLFSTVPPAELADVASTLKLLLNRDTPPGTCFLIDALTKARPDGSRRRLELAISLAAYDASSTGDGEAHALSHITVRVITPPEDSSGC